jgi:hypothetical protein
MAMPTILVATWSDGLFRVAGDAVHPEMRDGPFRGLAQDGRGGVLAVAGRHALRRRSPDGAWRELARSDRLLSCCAASGDAVFVGTDDAQVLRLREDGALERLAGFDAVAGRETWYAGQALVDGRMMGPPLGIRSMAATRGGALLANVHVGGIPRSADGGLTWVPTIDVDSDVHEVCAHPTRPELAIAATAVGLCISRDGGATWNVEQRGLHAPHCSAAGFGREHIYVSASTDPFSQDGAVYRRPIDGDGPLEPVGGGLPRWTEGKVDTGGIAARGSTIALVDWSGRLYVSQDDGASWSAPAVRFPEPSGICLI